MNIDGFPTGQTRRPVTVTAAAFLLYLAGTAQLVVVVLNVMTFGSTRRALDAYCVGCSAWADPGRTLFVDLVFGFGLTVGLGVLASLAGRGRSPARVLVWILSSFIAVCFGCNLGGGMNIGALQLGGSTLIRRPGPPDEIANAVYQVLPAWYSPTMVSLAASTIAATVVASILLAIPTSNRVFGIPR